MELAFHLRHIHEKDPLETGLKHLEAFYGDDEWTTNDQVKPSYHISRVYAGDEFCANRLPDKNQLEKIGGFCEKHHLGLSFLTPPLTDAGIDKCHPLFQYLSENMPAAEMVVNDIGVLCFMKENHPQLTLAMGRLFNKGFKDPRFDMPSKRATLSWDVRQLLNEGTFDQQAVIDMALQLSISRMECDLLPWAETWDKKTSEINHSIYFPFGYITTGRVCWISSFQKKGRQKFLINSECAQPCNDVPLLLKNDGCHFKLFQNGNTLFYLYPSSTLKGLLNAGANSNLRLVYQGFALS